MSFERALGPAFHLKGVVPAHRSGDDSSAHRAEFKIGSTHDQSHWVFGPFELIPDRLLLEKHGVRVAISPKPLAVLVHLIRHRDRVVPRAELLEQVWPGVSVSESAFLSVLRDLRRALDDQANAPRYVATVRGQGLRFVGSVHQLPSPGEAPPGLAERSAWERTAADLERALLSLDELDRMRGDSPNHEPPSRSRAELMVALGRARWAAGQPERARRVFLDAVDVAREAGDFETLGWAALGYVGRTDAPLVVNTLAVELLEEAIAGLSFEHMTLRAELLARLGTELYYEGDGTRSQALTAEALALAETTGSITAKAYALTARHYALSRPEFGPDERLPLCERAIELLSADDPTDLLCLALQQRQLDLLELGEGQAYRTVLAEYAKAVEAVGIAFFEWLCSAFEGNRLLISGYIDRAERQALATLERGQRIATPNAIPIFSVQLFSLRAEQGRLAELLPLVEAAAEQNPDMPVFRCGRVVALLAANERAAAERGLREVLAQGLEDIPFDMHRLPALALLATAASDLAVPAAIDAIEEALRPFDGRIISVGFGAGIQGAVSHHLGTLAAARGSIDEARAYLEAARALHEGLGAPLWQARSEQALRRLGGGDLPSAAP
jgi:DNA-binding winged helix-turn-helix (wHTH) protein